MEMISHDVCLGPLKSLGTLGRRHTIYIFVIDKSNAEDPGGANVMELWPHYTVKGVIKLKCKRV